MSFFPFASQSKLTALALVAGGLALAACDSTIEGGGSGGAGGGEESSATGIAQGGGDTGVGGHQSSVSTTSTGPGPGAATAIALYGFELPQGHGGGDVTVSVGAGGAGGDGTSVVAVGVGAGGHSSGEGGYGTAEAVGVGAGGEGGYGTSDVAVGQGVTVGGSEGEGGYGTSDVAVGQGVTVGGGDDGEGGYGSSGVGGGSPGPGGELDRLFLFISDDIVACADPHGVDDACGPRQFRASIGLPVQYQQVGIYDLNDPAIISSYSAWEGDGQECMGEGGSFFEGTIEVLSVDQNVIRVRLSGTLPADVDGEHDVIRCSSGQPPDETSVLGYFPSGLPPYESGSSVQGVGGSGPGDEVFIVDFADHAQSCPDPYADQPGPGEQHENFSIHLPTSYLAPGTYSLSDPAITTIYTQMEESTAVAGGGPGNEPGTLTIFQVTDTFINLQLEGATHAWANGGGQIPRCN